MAIQMGLDGDEPQELHEINVTPFIDVILVLLITFMIAAPLATVSVPLDLPVSTAEAAPDPQEPVTVSLSRDLQVSLADRQVARAALGAELDRVSHGDKQVRIFVRADKAVPYGDVMALMDDLRAAQFLKVGLVALEAGPPPSGGR